MKEANPLYLVKDVQKRIDVDIKGNVEHNKKKINNVTNESFLHNIL